MDRVETYVGETVYEWLFSKQAQNDMVGLAKVAAAMLGTGGMVNGLPCTQTTVPSMQVSIGQGELYQMASLEATVCGTLPSDTVNTVLKQGVLLGSAAPFNLPASSTFAPPGTTGQSINYLIEAQYQDQDVSIDPTTGTTPVVLQYYNSANPATPWSGPNNSGATSNTFRKGVIVFQVKAGSAATTGTQITPTPDSGWLGLYVVTVAFGASTITNSNIAGYVGAQILPSGGIVNAIQASALIVGADTGAANACAVAYLPALTSLTDGMMLWFKAAAANTGATTLNVNGLGAKPVVGAAHTALQGGEIVANGKCLVVYSTTLSSFVLIECTGGALQVAPATQSQHAVQLSQISGRLINIRTFTSSGTYTPTLGTNSVVVTLIGGGGGGGSAAPTAASNCSAGPGGGGGGWSKKRITSGFSGVAITVGLGGTAGNTGGTTIFGGLFSAVGGGGGSPGGGAAYSTPTANGFTLGGSGSGGDINGTGGYGSFALYFANPVSGGGGFSLLGAGAGYVNATTTSPGTTASVPGAGGSGAANAQSQGSAATGGSGAPGLVIVEEYA